MNKRIAPRLILCILLLGSWSMATEVSKTGTTAAKFLNMGVGPRTVAMGGAYAAIDNDVSAMYWNPAGIAKVNQFQGLFTQTNWIADINLNYIGLVVPTNGSGNFGVNITAVTMGDMLETTEDFPEGTGNTFSAGMYAIGLTYARNLTQNFVIGANIKYVQESISNSTARGFAIDIGTIFDTPFYGVKFSTAITNFGTKMQMAGEDLLFQYNSDINRKGSVDRLNSYVETEKFDLPLRLQLGLSRDFRLVEGQRLTLALDAALPSDNTQYVNAGGELGLFNDLVFLRGGYKTLFIRDREEGLTAGAGLRYNQLAGLKLTIDYAYQDFTYLGDVHTFGIQLGF